MEILRFRQLVLFAGAIVSGCASGPQSAQSLPPGATIARSTGGSGQTRYDLLHRLPATENVIYGFPNSAADGYSPHAGLLNVNGTFYGTTFLGGMGFLEDGYGTVFKITSSGAETVLHFFDGTDGSHPLASLINFNKMLYGTTQSGGNSIFGDGTVFAMTRTGTLKTLHQFAGSPDGASPYSALIALNGRLYGTTCGGGQYGYGTVFGVTTTGVEGVVYSFQGGSDGACPVADLINIRGTLYGTTQSGGSSNDGTVFSVTTSGVEKVLHTFAGSPDGSAPVAGLTNVNGIIYGTTAGGGSTTCSNPPYHGCGTVFSMHLSGNETILHRFTGPSDGANPSANLLNVNGLMFSTTANGGSSCAYFGTCGTVYAITTSGQEKVIYRFMGGLNGHADGTLPLGALIGVQGKLLYGTTAGGGPYACGYGSGGCGTVFEVTL